MTVYGGGGGGRCDNGRVECGGGNRYGVVEAAMVLFIAAVEVLESTGGQGDGGCSGSGGNEGG